MTTKPNMEIAWAENAAAPDIVAPGDTKLALGWLGTDLPPHNYFNFIDNRTDTYLQHLNEEGIPMWDADTAYPIKGLAKGSDGLVYSSKTASNTNNDPTGGGDTINWSLFVPEDIPQEIRTPTNVSPFDTETGVTNPILEGDFYASVYNILHSKSQFQVATDDQFNTIIYDSGSIPATIEHTVPGGSLSVLTEYYWAVRYKSAENVWSEYSDPTLFETGAVLIYLDQPTITFPTDASTDISKIPTLTGSAFSVVGGSDTHISSRWKIASDPSFSNMIYDTGFITDLESHLVPEGILSGLITYYVSVQYKGLTLGNSAISAFNSFTTTQLETDWLNYDGSEDGAEIQTSSATTSPGDNTFTIVQIASNVVSTLYDAGANVRVTNYLKTGSSLSSLVELVETGAEPLGGFPANSSILISDTLLRVFDSTGINYSDETVSPSLLYPSRVWGSDAYVQFSDNLFYIGGATGFFGYSLNDIGDNVTAGLLATTYSQKIALSRDKRYLVGCNVNSNSEYNIDSMPAGGIDGSTIDTYNRAVTKDANVGSIEFFDEEYFGFFYIKVDDISVDVFKLESDGSIANISTDNLIGDLTTNTLHNTSQLENNLVLLTTSDGRHVVSYDIDTDTVAIEAEVTGTASEAHTNIKTLNDDSVFGYKADKATETVQILSAEV